MFFHAFYGGWTFASIMNYMKISQNCRDQISVSMLTFDLTMIIGCFSAVNILFVLMVIMIILPIIAYQSWKSYRQRTEYTRMTKSLFKTLIVQPYNQTRFRGVTECAICLDEYTPESKVTPLPCKNTNLHVFHSECIKKWFQKENKCPLCKEYVTVYDCKNLSK